MQSPSTQPFKVCPNCQQRLALHMTRCGRCGSAQTPSTSAPTPTSLPCPDCGYLMTSLDKTCPRCLTLPPRRAPAPQPPQAVSLPVASAMPLPMAPLIIPCVTCGNADVQKVTAIHQAGTWTADAHSVSVGGGHVWGGPNFTAVGTTTTKEKGTTAIAALLAPPVSPRYRPSGVGAFGIAGMVPLGGFLTLGIVGVYCSLPNPRIDGLSISVLVMGLALIAGGLALFFSDRKQEPIRRADHERDEVQWERAMQMWDTLLYCQRCDSVYLPHTRHAAPSRQMHGLIGF